MNIESAVNEINKFWQAGEALPFGRSDNSSHIERLKGEYSVELPQVLLEYIQGFVPATDFYFDTVGNPVCIYGIENLKYKQDGYTYNPVKKEDIENWDKSHFIFGDEGADPVIIDLEKPQEGIQKLRHGAGNWESGLTVSDSIGQFLLCSAAQHHALNNFEEDPIVDDEKGFNLAEKAAKWYFARMKKWAGSYYEDWCSVFDNH
jgi:hypothetical protein